MHVKIQQDYNIHGISPEVFLGFLPANFTNPLPSTLVLFGSSALKHKKTRET